MYILIAPMADMTTMFYWALKYLTCYYLDFDMKLTCELSWNLRIYKNNIMADYCLCNIEFFR